MSVASESFSKSIKGSVHPYEDRILVDETRQLYAVADGVTLSSQGSGGVAAELALKLLQENFLGDLSKAIEHVHGMVSEIRRRDTAIGETTLTGAYVERGMLEVANVGDSPAYLVRADGLSCMIHEDKDSFGYITQVIGQPEKIRVHRVRTRLEKGDCIIIASDGMRHVLGPSTVLPLVRRGLGAREVVEALVEEARAQSTGYDDDKSIIFVRIIRV